MTIKPRKLKTGRKFGTRRQYRRNRGKLGQWINVDFETHAFGIDVGRKDESVAVMARKLPSGRIIFSTLKFPEFSKEQAAAQLAEYRATFEFPARLYRSSPPSALPIVETVDYSTIEERIMAHMANKAGIVDALRERMKAGAVRLPLDKELLADLRDIKKSD